MSFTSIVMSRFMSVSSSYALRKSRSLVPCALNAFWYPINNAQYLLFCLCAGKKLFNYIFSSYRELTNLRVTHMATLSKLFFYNVDLIKMKTDALKYSSDKSSNCHSVLRLNLFLYIV